MSHDIRRSEDEPAPELTSDHEAQLDELGTDPGQVGDRSAGQSGDSQALSSEEDANNESVEELADTDQALEAAAVEGSKMPLIIQSVLFIPMKNMAVPMTRLRDENATLPENI